MLNSKTPFMLTALKFKKGGQFEIGYMLDTGNGYQEMSATFDPHVQLLNEEQVAVLENLIGNLLPHVNHFVNNVPHQSVYDYLTGQGYYFDEVSEMMAEYLDGGELSETLPLQNFPDGYENYVALQSQLFVDEIAFGELQATVTIKVRKCTMTTNSPTSGPVLKIDVPFNLKDVMAHRSACGYLFYEALRQDLTRIQDSCQWFVENCLEAQNHQLSLFNAGNYVNHSAEASSDGGKFNLDEPDEALLEDFRAAMEDAGVTVTVTDIQVGSKRKKEVA